MGSPLDLYDTAEELLDVVAEALDTLTAAGLNGAPARQVVSPTSPTFELCDTLSVGWVLTQADPIQPGQPEGQQKVGRVNLVTFLIAVARCVRQEGGRSAPREISLRDQSQQTYADAWVVWSAIYWRSRNNTLFGGDRCQVRNLQGGLPVDPQPGVVGSLTTFQTELDGFNYVEWAEDPSAFLPVT